MNQFVLSQQAIGLYHGDQSCMQERFIWKKAYGYIPMASINTFYCVKHNQHAYCGANQGVPPL